MLCFPPPCLWLNSLFVCSHFRECQHLWCRAWLFFSFFLLCQGLSCIWMETWNWTRGNYLTTADWIPDTMWGNSCFLPHQFPLLSILLVPEVTPWLSVFLHRAEPRTWELLGFLLGWQVKRWFCQEVQSDVYVHSFKGMVTLCKQLGRIIFLKSGQIMQVSPSCNRCLWLMALVLLRVTMI